MGITNVKEKTNIYFPLTSYSNIKKRKKRGLAYIRRIQSLVGNL